MGVEMLLLWVTLAEAGGDSERLASARKVLVVSDGTQVAPAHDAAYRLSVLGPSASAPAS